MRILLTVIFLFPVLSPAFGQNAVKDSLQTIVYSGAKNRKVVDATLQLTLQYLHNHDTAAHLAERGLMIARSLEYRKGIGRSLYNLALAHHYHGKQHLARPLYLEALTYADDTLQAQLYNNLGVIYNKQGNYVKSQDYFQRSLNLKLKIKDKRSLGNTYGNLGIIKYYQKNYQEALDLYHKAYQAELETQNREKQASALGNMGLTYIRLGNMEAAETYYRQAFQITQSLDISGASAYAAAGLAEAYFHLDKLKPARNFGELAYAEGQKTGDSTVIASALHTLGLITTKERNYEAAKKFLSEGLLVARTAGLKEEEKNLLEAMYLLHKETGDYQSSLDYLEAFHQLSDTLFNEDLTRRLTETELTYTFNQEKDSLSFAHQKETIALNADLAQQKFIQRASAAGVVLLIVVVFILYRFYKLKVRSNRQLLDKNRIIDQALNKNQLLMREIHHRVKNNLQIVSSMLSIQSGYLEDSKARQVVNDIQSRVMSMAMVHQDLYKGEDVTEVNAETYLENLLASLEESFTDERHPIDFNLQVKPFTISSDYAVNLGLIINEITTNALKYAFPPEFTGEPEICVSLGKQDKQVLLVVKDNGVGMDRETAMVSYGTRLINTLTRSMGGTVNYSNGHGTKVEVNFTIQDEN